MADPVKLALLAGIGLTLAWGGYEYRRDNQAIPEIDSEAHASGKVRPVQVQQPETLPLEEFSAIIERPLFFADRKLPVEKNDNKEENKARNATPPNFRLSAIVIDDEEAIALVETRGKNETQLLRQGEVLSGWRLERIEEDAIVLRADDEQQRVQLHDFSSLPTPAVRQRPTPPEPRVIPRGRRAPMDRRRFGRPPEPPMPPEIDMPGR